MPGNAGGAKDPDFRHAFEVGEVKVIGDEPGNTGKDPDPSHGQSDIEPNLGASGVGAQISAKLSIPLPPRWVLIKFRLGAARRGSPLQGLVNITKYPDVERALNIVTGAEVTKCEIERDMPVQLTPEQRAALALLGDGVKPAPTVLQQRDRTLAATKMQARPATITT